MGVMRDHGASPFKIRMDKANLAGQVWRKCQSPLVSSQTPFEACGRVIEVLAYPSVQLLDVTGPLQVFASANDLVAQAGGTPPYVLRVVAKGGQGVTASAGLGLATRPLPRTGAPLDTLIVAGGPGVERRPPIRRWSIGCGSVRRRRVASPRSAPERSCWLPRACSTDGAR